MHKDESIEFRRSNPSKQQYWRVGSAAPRQPEPPESSRTQADSSRFQSSFERKVIPPLSRRSMESLRQGEQTPVNLQPTLEVYECGCRIHYQVIDYGECDGDLPQTLVLVPEITSCEKHEGRGLTSPPPDARLVAVLHENESYLNE